MKRLLIPGFSILFLFTACLEGEEPVVDDTGPVDYTVSLDIPENGYQLSSEPYIVGPGEERYTCDVVRIDPHDGEQYAWINALESRSSQSSHHMNVNLGMFSVGDIVSGEGGAEFLLRKPPGQYDCAELGDLMSGQGLQTLYPSQRTEQGGDLPAGVALPLPLPLVVIMEHHYINPTDRPVKVNAVLNLTAIEEDKVEHVVTGFAAGIRGGDRRIEIPPNSRKIEAKTCVVDRPINVFAISSHSHQAAGCFSMNLYSEDEGIAAEPFFINKDWESPPIVFFEQEDWTNFETLPMQAGDGIHWACHYYNEGDTAIESGARATDEMCIFVAMGYPSKNSVADIKAAFEDPTVESLMNTLMETVPCTTVDEEIAGNYWPEANMAIELTASDSRWDACQGYEQTR